MPLNKSNNERYWIAWKSVTHSSRRMESVNKGIRPTAIKKGLTPAQKEAKKAEILAELANLGYTLKGVND